MLQLCYSYFVFYSSLSYVDVYVQWLFIFYGCSVYFSPYDMVYNRLFVMAMVNTDIICFANMIASNDRQI